MWHCSRHALPRSYIISAQGWGQLFAPLVFMGLLHTRLSHHLAWRVAIALGIIPPLCICMHAGCSCLILLWIWCWWWWWRDDDKDQYHHHHHHRRRHLRINNQRQYLLQSQHRLIRIVFITCRIGHMPFSLPASSAGHRSRSLSLRLQSTCVSCANCLNVFIHPVH